MRRGNRQSLEACKGSERGNNEREKVSSTRLMGPLLAIFITRTVLPYNSQSQLLLLLFPRTYMILL